MTIHFLNFSNQYISGYSNGGQSSNLLLQNMSVNSSYNNYNSYGGHGGHGHSHDDHSGKLYRPLDLFQRTIQTKKNGSNLEGILDPFVLACIQMS